MKLSLKSAIFVFAVSGILLTGALSIKSNSGSHKTKIPAKPEKESIKYFYKGGSVNLFTDLKNEEDRAFGPVANLWIENKDGSNKTEIYRDMETDVDSCGVEEIWLSPTGKRLIFSEVFCGNWASYTYHLVTLDVNDFKKTKVKKLKNLVMLGLDPARILDWVGNDHIAYEKVSYYGVSEGSYTYPKYDHSIRELVLLDVNSGKEQRLTVEEE